MKAETWLHPSVTEQNMFSAAERKLSSWHELESASVAVVLGAGNVSSIAATDMLSKILIENFSVIVLKMNPVNDYLTSLTLKTAFKPLIESNLLRIVQGGRETWVSNLIDHPIATHSIHVTGSEQTHDCIVWGQGEEAEKRKLS